MFMDMFPDEGGTHPLIPAHAPAAAGPAFDKQTGCHIRASIPGEPLGILDALVKIAEPRQLDAPVGHRLPVVVVQAAYDVQEMQVLRTRMERDLFPVVIRDEDPLLDIPALGFGADKTGLVGEEKHLDFLAEGEERRLPDTARLQGAFKQFGFLVGFRHQRLTGQTISIEPVLDRAPLQQTDFTHMILSFPESLSHRPG